MAIGRGGIRQQAIDLAKGKGDEGAKGWFK